MNKAWNILLRKFPQKPLFSEDTATRPVSVSVDEVVQGNNRMLRKRIVLKTGGCQTKTCTMCAIPTESIPSKISTEDIIAQLNFSWNTQEPVSIITLYTNGNFFYDKEMSESTRVAIYRWCSSKGITHLVVESLPNFVTAEKLAVAKEILGPIKLEVAIGLQCWDDALRDWTVNSLCTSEAFKNATTLLADNNYSTRAFVLQGLPFLDKEEGLFALLETLDAIRCMPLSGVVICPLKPSKGTIAEAAYLQGISNSAFPSLYDVYHLCERLEHQQFNFPVVISTSLLSYEESMPRSACCEQTLVNAISQFNQGNKMPELSVCSCGAGANRVTPRPYDLAALQKKVLSFTSR